MTVSRSMSGQMKYGMVFNIGKFEPLRFWLERETALDILNLSPVGHGEGVLQVIGDRVRTDHSFNYQVDMTMEWLVLKV